jgi:hypothetical protein
LGQLVGGLEVAVRAALKRKTCSRRGLRISGGSRHLAKPNLSIAGARASRNARNTAENLGDAIASALSGWADRFRQGASTVGDQSAALGRDAAKLGTVAVNRAEWRNTWVIKTRQELPGINRIREPKFRDALLLLRQLKVLTMLNPFQPAARLHDRSRQCVLVG